MSSVDGFYFYLLTKINFSRKASQESVTKYLQIFLKSHPFIKSLYFKLSARILSVLHLKGPKGICLQAQSLDGKYSRLKRGLVGFLGARGSFLS